MSKTRFAIKDIWNSFYRSKFWFTIAWQEIKQRYKRSVIGPFWITISMGIMILAMGPLYGHLFKIDTASYIKYLSVSLIFWTFVSTCITEACTVFIASESYIKQIKLPYSGYILKLMYKNIIYLLHNFVILIVVLFMFPVNTFYQFIFFPIAITIVFFNLFFFSIIIGLFCLRFRDGPLIVSSIMQVMFFISPILWKPESLGERGLLIAEINPIYHLIEVMRSAIFGGILDNYYSYLYSIILLITLASVAIIFFARFRSRIPYWL